MECALPSAEEVTSAPSVPTLARCVSGDAYVTVVCSCKRPKYTGEHPWPRYCGNGRHVLKLKPATFNRDWDVFLGIEKVDRSSFPAAVMPAVVVDPSDSRVGS